MTNKEKNIAKKEKPEMKTVEVFKYSGFSSEEEARSWMKEMREYFDGVKKVLQRPYLFTFPPLFWYTSSLLPLPLLIIEEKEVKE